jgi:hypothetical protein
MSTFIYAFKMIPHQGLHNSPVVANHQNSQMFPAFPYILVHFGLNAVNNLVPNFFTYLINVFWKIQTKIWFKTENGHSKLLFINVAIKNVCTAAFHSTSYREEMDLQRLWLYR